MRAALPVVLTPTRAELGSRCERRHVLTDLLEYGKAKSPSAAFGNVIHAGAAAWWQAQWDVDLPAVALAKTHAAVDEAYGLFMAEVEYPKDHTVELAHSMIDYYVQHASATGPFTGHYKPVSVETRIELPLADGIRLSFQQDRVYHNQDTQHLLVMDLKTSSRMDNRWRTQWYRSLQMKLYRLAAMRLYETDNVDIVIEGISKAAKPKLEYVVLPAWSDALLTEAEIQFLRVAAGDKKLLEAASTCSKGTCLVDVDALELAAVVNTAVNYHDCDSYGFPCPFLPLCTAEPDERRALLHAGYKQIIQDY